MTDTHKAAVLKMADGLELSLVDMVKAGLLEVNEVRAFYGLNPIAPK